jgi:hypothetical protein
MRIYINTGDNSKHTLRNRLGIMHILLTLFHTLRNTLTNEEIYVLEEDTFRYYEKLLEIE